MIVWSRDSRLPHHNIYRTRTLDDRDLLPVKQTDYHGLVCARFTQTKFNKGHVDRFQFRQQQTTSFCVARW